MRASVWVRIVVGLALMAGVGVAVGNAREAVGRRGAEGIEYLPSGEVLRLVSAGFDEVLADLLWFRTIQYYGEWRRGDHGIQFFEQIALTVVELDPRFEQAYRFTGMVLADDMRSPERGVDFLRLGMAKLPNSWWLPFEAGFIEYVQRKDDAAAANWFRHAAEVPGAPDYPRRFAAFAASRAGDLRVSYELWSYIAQTTTNDALRDKAEQYMIQLEAALNGGPVPVWAIRPNVEVSR